MLRGLYSATTNLDYNMKRLDAISNNMANINTTGFKKDDVFSESFNDLLINKLNGSSTPGQPPFTGVVVNKMDDGQITLSTTSGYFRTTTGRGTSNNRDMMFGIDKDGYLSTVNYNSDRKIDYKYGNKVIDKDGNPVNVGVGAKLEVDKDGNLLVGGAKKASLLFTPSSNTIGTFNAGVYAKRVVTDFNQGNSIPTEEKNDFALNGPGFFVVDSSIGNAYTRNGSFKVDSNLYLVTSEGFRVQGIKGDIKLTSPEFATNTFGEIVVDGQVVDKIKTVNFDNTGDLEKAGGTYFIVPQNITLAEKPYTGEVVQGFLERSNVDSATEMIKMLSLYREYESGQKLIKVYDETLTKAVNDIARL